MDHYVQDHLDFHVKKVHKKAEEKSGKEWTSKRDTCKRNPQYCDRCDRNFASDAHFLTHCKKVHNEIPPQFADRKQFKCNTCHEIFFNKYYLDRHKEKHDPSAIKKQNIAKKKVECPQCQKALTSNQKLKNHIKNMHGERTIESLDVTMEKEKKEREKEFKKNFEMVKLESTSWTLDIPMRKKK